jgi:hypothetical protein
VLTFFLTSNLKASPIFYGPGTISLTIASFPGIAKSDLILTFLKKAVNGTTAFAAFT